jgi:hypothetical protein
MAAKRNVSVPVSEVEASAASKAYDAVRSRLEAIPRGELLPVRIDVQAAAAVAHSVAIRDSERERRQAFERLASAQVFDLAALDSLNDVALTAWHARQQQLAAGAGSSAAVPIAVVGEAQDVRGRMLRLLEYYFDDDVELGPKLSIIRSGRGHQDLANDLEMVADLYEDSEVRALISRDPKHYRAGDPRAARAFAAEIFKSLGLSPANTSAAETTQRAWTLLSQPYDQVNRAGRFLFPDQEDVNATYPSLIGYVRAPASRSGAGEPGTASGGASVPAG